MPDVQEISLAQPQHINRWTRTIDTIAQPQPNRTAKPTERDIRANGPETAAPERLARPWRNPRLPISGAGAGMIGEGG